MRGLTKALMAAVAALIIGFGAGEVFGPEALEAGDIPCDHMRCFVVTTWPAADYECRAAEDELDCGIFFGGEYCSHQECDDPT